MTGVRAWLPVAALGAIALGVVAVTAAVRLPAGVSLNYGEGFIQLDVLRAARGEPLYGDPALAPWTIQVYTPLYLWLASLLARAGLDGYSAGRALGYAAVLASALLIGASGRRGPVAWGVAAFYLTLPLFVVWGAAVRPDNLAVFLSLAGIVVADRFTGHRKVYLAVPLFLAAGLAKQSSVAAPLAAVLWLALRDPRRALPFAALLTAAAVACAAALQLGSGGWFWLHAVTSHGAKPFAWGQLEAVAVAFARHHGALLLFAVGLIGWLLVRRRLSLEVLWLLLSILAVASAGKLGSDTNYLLEPVAALALVAARELPLPLAPGATRMQRALAAAAVVAAVVVAAHNLQLHLANAAWIPEAERHFQAVARQWGDTPGDVIADDAGFLVSTGKPLLYRPFIMTQLAEAGLWDERPLVEALESGRVGLVVVQRDPASLFRSRYTPRQRAALERHYRRVGAYRTDFAYELYAPLRTRSDASTR